MSKYPILLSIIILTIIASCNQQEVSIADTEAYVAEVKKNVTPVTVDELNTLMEENGEYLLLDMREPTEHDPGYIPGSVNLPRGTLEFNIGKKEFWDHQSLYVPEKEQVIIVYCKKGSRSILAAETLQKMGYTNVRYIDGGFKQWEYAYPKNIDFNKVSHDDHGGEVGGC